MRLKDERIQGEIFVIGEDLFSAVKNLDKGFIHQDEVVADASCRYPERVFRVEVTIFEA